MSTFMFLLVPDELGNLSAVLLSVICGSTELRVGTEHSPCSGVFLNQGLHMR